MILTGIRCISKGTLEGSNANLLPRQVGMSSFQFKDHYISEFQTTFYEKDENTGDKKKISFNYIWDSFTMRLLDELVTEHY